MAEFFSSLLRRYDPEDSELRLKAGFILFISLIFILFLIPVFAYTAYLSGISSIKSVVTVLGLFFSVSALMVLIRGHYTFAAHMILTAGFAAPWIIMFQESYVTILTRLDTVIYITGLLAAMPLFFFKTIRPMIFYFCTNIILFGLLLARIRYDGLLSGIEFLDYALDNLVVMAFVFTCGITLFLINQKVLTALKDELKERKKAETRLDRLRVLLANTINSMPSIIVGVNPAFEVILFNREAEKILRLAAPQVLHQPFPDLFPQLAPYARTIRDVISDQILSQTFRVDMDMGENRSVYDMTIYPISPSDEGGAVIRMDECSERIKMEEIMVQSEKMLSIGGLAAGMAHEINNPLAGMIQSTQVIRNRLSRSMPANEKITRELGISMDAITLFMEKREIFKFLDHLLDAGTRAARIVDNMLGFARAAASQKAPEDIAELIEEAIILARSDYGLKKNHDFKKIDLVRNFQEGLPKVPCEKPKIQQVLFNILKNAAEAMASESCEGQARITLDLKQEGHYLSIRISDNGPGMDEATRKRIFEPFFTTKATGQGTGLGMSVSYFIITEDHAGKMSAESAPGRGTAFNIMLPIK